MKVTAWTNEEYAREHYQDLFDERLALLNLNKKALSSDDEDRANNYINIINKIEKCIIEHCKEKGIRFSADYHQYGDFGIPIIDDKFMYMGFARTWGWIMAQADCDFSDKGYLRYYLHGNENKCVYPNEVGENCIE